ncbi:uncharacterized protein EV154DRAFT_551883 [Mucor mucedo]|uniref:uncharacterized protein n=1 Tax=Mucor mucedo TaxID=29922 RepID=UPI0022206995|nr:uncharacterized protein EV154DRAFT_551883 [Mucor mucedo]KAI7891021.1 hypothetical protein EV154DRAFT_551883 [Mucor mucedo]
MKVLSQLLGRYSEHNKPFILFRLPETDVLLYRLSDIKPLFNIPTFSFKKATYKNCFRDGEDTYLDTNVLGDLAHQFNRHLLAELCKLKPNDYNLGLADAILQTFPQFKRAPKEEHIWESVQLPLENMEDVIDRTIKIEPISPPNIHQVIPEARNAMALDKVLLSSNELKRQSLLESPNKRQRIGTGSQSIESDRDNKRPHSLSAVTAGNNSAPLSRQIRKIQSHPVSEMEDTAAPVPSSSKRLSIKHKNSLNLTIFAPSYNEQLTGVRSAPINSNFNRPLPNQPAQQNTRSNYANHGPAVGSTPHNIAPASATIARAPFTHQPSPRRHEFAIPPIVPSQQQPPRSAHPTSRDNKLYQQYIASPSLYGGHHPHTTKPQPSSYQRNHESTLAVNAASVPLPPKTPTTNSFAALQRQQYLQPFEHLFDTIETTRTLKSTLDDQIRRSSSLMQTLQTSATTIEGLVRNQVKEAQWEMMSQVEQTMESMVRRVEAIEAKLDRASGISPIKKQLQRQPELNYQHTTSLPSPLPSATREERAAAEDLVAFSKREGTEQHEELQTPPTIVRSQNDIGPQEYHNMLDTLRERLDRLERQIDT